MSSEYGATALPVVLSAPNPALPLAPVEPAAFASLVLNAILYTAPADIANPQFDPFTRTDKTDPVVFRDISLYDIHNKVPNIVKLAAVSPNAKCFVVLLCNNAAVLKRDGFYLLPPPGAAGRVGLLPDEKALQRMERTNRAPRATLFSRGVTPLPLECTATGAALEAAALAVSDFGDVCLVAAGGNVFVYDHRTGLDAPDAYREYAVFQDVVECDDIYVDPEETGPATTTFACVFPPASADATVMDNDLYVARVSANRKGLTVDRRLFKRGDAQDAGEGEGAAAEPPAGPRTSVCASACTSAYAWKPLYMRPVGIELVFEGPVRSILCSMHPLGKTLVVVYNGLLLMVPYLLSFRRDPCSEQLRVRERCIGGALRGSSTRYAPPGKAGLSHKAAANRYLRARDGAGPQAAPALAPAAASAPASGGFAPRHFYYYTPSDDTHIANIASINLTYAITRYAPTSLHGGASQGAAMARVVPRSIVWTQDAAVLVVVYPGFLLFASSAGCLFSVSHQRLATIPLQRAVHSFGPFVAFASPAPAATALPRSANVGLTALFVRGRDLVVRVDKALRVMRLELLYNNDTAYTDVGNNIVTYPERWAATASFAATLISLRALPLGDKHSADFLRMYFEGAANVLGFVVSRMVTGHFWGGTLVLAASPFAGAAAQSLIGMGSNDRVVREADIASNLLLFLAEFNSRVQTALVLSLARLVYYLRLEGPDPGAPPPDGAGSIFLEVSEVEEDLRRDRMQGRPAGPAGPAGGAGGAALEPCDSELLLLVASLPFNLLARRLNSCISPLLLHVSRSIYNTVLNTLYSLLEVDRDQVRCVFENLSAAPRTALHTLAPLDGYGAGGRGRTFALYFYRLLRLYDGDILARTGSSALELVRITNLFLNLAGLLSKYYVFLGNLQQTSGRQTPAAGALAAAAQQARDEGAAARAEGLPLSTTLGSAQASVQASVQGTAQGTADPDNTPCYRYSCAACAPLMYVALGYACFARDALVSAKRNNAAMGRQQILLETVVRAVAHRLGLLALSRFVGDVLAQAAPASDLDAVPLLPLYLLSLHYPSQAEVRRPFRPRDAASFRPLGNTVPAPGVMPRLILAVYGDTFAVDNIAFRDAEFASACRDFLTGVESSLPNLLLARKSYLENDPKSLVYTLYQLFLRGQLQLVVDRCLGEEHATGESLPATEDCEQPRPRIATVNADANVSSLFSIISTFTVGKTIARQDLEYLLTLRTFLSRHLSTWLFGLLHVLSLSSEGAVPVANLFLLGAGEAQERSIRSVLHAEDMERYIAGLPPSYKALFTVFGGAVACVCAERPQDAAYMLVRRGFTGHALALLRLLTAPAFTAHLEQAIASRRDDLQRLLPTGASTHKPEGSDALAAAHLKEDIAALSRARCAVPRLLQLLGRLEKAAGDTLPGTEPHRAAGLTSGERRELLATGRVPESALKRLDTVEGSAEPEAHEKSMGPADAQLRPAERAMLQASGRDLGAFSALCTPADKGPAAQTIRPVPKQAALFEHSAQTDGAPPQAPMPMPSTPASAPHPEYVEPEKGPAAEPPAKPTAVSVRTAPQAPSQNPSNSSDTLTNLKAATPDAMSSEIRAPTQPEQVPAPVRDRTTRVPYRDELGFRAPADPSSLPAPRPGAFGAAPVQRSYHGIPGISLDHCDPFVSQSAIPRNTFIPQRPVGQQYSSTPFKPSGVSRTSVPLVDTAPYGRSAMMPSSRSKKVSLIQLNPQAPSLARVPLISINQPVGRVPNVSLSQPPHPVHSYPYQQQRPPLHSQTDYNSSMRTNATMSSIPSHGSSVIGPYVSRPPNNGYDRSIPSLRGDSDYIPDYDASINPSDFQRQPPEAARGASLITRPEQSGLEQASPPPTLEDMYRVVPREPRPAPAPAPAQQRPPSRAPPAVPSADHRPSGADTKRPLAPQDDRDRRLANMYQRVLPASPAPERPRDDMLTTENDPFLNELRNIQQRAIQKSDEAKSLVQDLQRVSKKFDRGDRSSLLDTHVAGQPLPRRSYD